MGSAVDLLVGGRTARPFNKAGILRLRQASGGAGCTNWLFFQYGWHLNLFDYGGGIRSPSTQY